MGVILHVATVELMNEPRAALHHLMEASGSTRTGGSSSSSPSTQFASPGSVWEFAAFVFADAQFERLPGDKPRISGP